MIAVVYSGSNYADWRLADRDNIIASFKTSGINPYFSDEESITQVFNKNINLIHHAEEVKRVYFFGAGASSPELKLIVQNAFTRFFKFAKVTIEHDITGAAIATCKTNAGIICICGSGTNAAWYDGRKIKPNNFGLGYILADEGSGNWLGRELIKRFMNETLPENTLRKFKARYDFDRKTLLEKVYRQKNPAIFLSSFNSFYIENRNDDFLNSVVRDGFHKLVHTYLLPLNEQHPNALLYFAGSIAYGFQTELTEAVNHANLKVGTIIKEPINNLLMYYSNKN